MSAYPNMFDSAEVKGKCQESSAGKSIKGQC